MKEIIINSPTHGIKKIGNYILIDPECVAWEKITYNGFGLGEVAEPEAK